MPETTSGLFMFSRSTWEVVRSLGYSVAPDAPDPVKRLWRGEVDVSEPPSRVTPAVGAEIGFAIESLGVVMSKRRNHSYHAFEHNIENETIMRFAKANLRRGHITDAGRAMIMMVSAGAGRELVLDYIRGTVANATVAC